jgi:hypothetical protein
VCSSAKRATRAPANIQFSIYKPKKLSREHKNRQKGKTCFYDESINGNSGIFFLLAFFHCLQLHDAVFFRFLFFHCWSWSCMLPHKSINIWRNACQWLHISTVFNWNKKKSWQRWTFFHVAFRRIFFLNFREDKKMRMNIFFVLSIRMFGFAAEGKHFR